jgi:PBSX family phage terminase large subunit
MSTWRWSPLNTLLLFPKEIDLRWPASPAQAEFISAPERFTAFIGGVGSGKTYAGALKAVFGPVQGPGTGMVVAPTYRMLLDVLVPTLRKVMERWLEDTGLPGEVVFRKGDMLFETPTAHTILLRSADRPDRLRGPNLDWAWIDEAAICPADTWRIVIGRLRAGGKAGPCWVTSTPKGRNWLYEELPHFRVIRATTYDNPFLDREFVNSLSRAYAGAFARQEIYAEFVAFEGLIYSFDRARHVVHEPPDPQDLERVFAGVDWGFNVAVVLIVGLGRDGVVWVLDEWYGRRVTIDEHIQAARQLFAEYHPDVFYADPSSPAYIEQFNRAGLPTVPAVNDFIPGVSTVETLLNQDRLRVLSACANTIAEFESYQWRRRSDGKIVKEKPAPGQPDHAMDALRYALHTGITVASTAQGWLDHLRRLKATLAERSEGYEHRHPDT